MQMRSIVASNTEIVKNTCESICTVLCQFYNRIVSFFFHVEIISRPSLKIVDVLLSREGYHFISLLAIDLLEDFFEWVFGLVSVVVVKLVHVESEVRKHLLIEFVEELVLIWVCTMHLSQDISEQHEEPTLI